MNQKQAAEKRYANLKYLWLKENEKNAELLAVLKDISDWCGTDDGAQALPYKPPWAEQMRQAIAKAEGSE